MNVFSSKVLDPASSNLLLTLQDLGIPLSSDDRSTRVSVTKSASRVSLAPLYSSYFLKAQPRSAPCFGGPPFLSNTDTTTASTTSAAGLLAADNNNNDDRQYRPPSSSVDVNVTTAAMLDDASTRLLLPSAPHLMYPLLSSSEQTATKVRTAKNFESPFSTGPASGAMFVCEVESVASNNNNSSSNSNNGKNAALTKKDADADDDGNDDNDSCRIAFLPSASVEDAQESLTRLAPRAQKLFSVIECAGKFAVLLKLVESGQSRAADLLSLAALDQLPPEISSSSSSSSFHSSTSASSFLAATAPTLVRDAKNGEEAKHLDEIDGDGGGEAGHRPAPAMSKTEKIVRFLNESDSSDDDDENDNADHDRRGDSPAASTSKTVPKPGSKKQPQRGQQQQAQKPKGKSSQVLQGAKDDFLKLMGSTTAAATTSSSSSSSTAILGSAAIAASSGMSSGMRDELTREDFAERARAKEMEERRQAERAHNRKQEAGLRRQRGE